MNEEKLSKRISELIKEIEQAKVDSMHFLRKS